MQNEEPQRPATARPSLLSGGQGQGETLKQGETAHILSELEGKAGKAPPPGTAARRSRKGLVAGTVLALAAMGGTAALVLRDVGTVAPMASVSQGLERGAAAQDGTQDGATSGGAQAADAGVTAVAAQAADQLLPPGGTAGTGPAAQAVAGTEPGMAVAPASDAGAGAAGAVSAAVVAAPAVALAAALAAPPADKASTAATIIDTSPAAAAEPVPVRKAVAKARKAAPAKERRARLAKAKSKAPEHKTAKVKTHKKPVPAPKASPDSDVELLAALVAHAKPPGGTRAAPCRQADDKSTGAGAACGADHKQ